MLKINSRSFDFKGAGVDEHHSLKRIKYDMEIHMAWKKNPISQHRPLKVKTGMRKQRRCKKQEGKKMDRKK